MDPQILKKEETNPLHHQQVEAKSITQLVSNEGITPKEAGRILFGVGNNVVPEHLMQFAPNPLASGVTTSIRSQTPEGPSMKSIKELDYAHNFGNFPNRPSELFLTLFSDVLKTVLNNEDPSVGLVSPSLLGSSGQIKASIVAPTRDILHYYVEKMMDAKHEIIMSAGFWENDSSNAKFLRHGFILLSQKWEKEYPGKKLVVKIIWDRGFPRNGSLHSHSHIKQEKLGKYQIPSKEAPNIDFEVVNYHRPILGTLHIKYLIVDHEILLLSSNNIQDKPNMEMSTHLEGPIVNSFYDTFLINWAIHFNSPLPLISTPATVKPGITEEIQNTFTNLQIHPLPSYFDSNGNEHKVPERNEEAAYTNLQEIHPLFLHSSIASRIVPMAVCNRHPHGAPGHRDSRNPQDEVWSSGFRNAKRSIFIQTPDFNAKPAMKGVIDACRRGVKVMLWLCYGYNYKKERLPWQGGTNVKVVNKLYRKLSEDKLGYEKNLTVCWHVAKGADKPHEDYDHCHIKFMSVDDQVAIYGSGNMDVQSWFHSAEVNVMVDSPELIEEWMNSFRMNQDTFVRGMIDPSKEIPIPQQIIQLLGPHES